jgi:hypothetical protein
MRRALYAFYQRRFKMDRQLFTPHEIKKQQAGGPIMAKAKKGDFFDALEGMTPQEREHYQTKGLQKAIEHACPCARGQGDLRASRD